MTDEAPLYGHREYPLRIACERLREVAIAKKDRRLKLLLWTPPKGFYLEKRGFGKQEVEYGYSQKEEDFTNEMLSVGDRWRWERAVNAEQLADHLSNDNFDAVVILGSAPAYIVRKAVFYYTDPRGPKTVLLEFEKRAWEQTDPYSVWSYLSTSGQLHLMRNFVHLANRKGLLKYLPVAFNRKTASDVEIWDVPAQKLTSWHIERLFEHHTEEGPRLDYKRAAAVRDRKDMDKLIERICGMANADGGTFVIGVSEIEGRPQLPIDIGLEDVGNPDAVINRLQQKIYDKFRRGAPELEFGSLRIRDKNILIIQVAESVTKHCGVKMIANQGLQVPVRKGRMTSWFPVNAEAEANRSNVSPLGKQ